MKLREIAAPDFDLVKTLNCGQVFHWSASGNGFVGLVADEPFYVEQHGDTLRVKAASANGRRKDHSGCRGTNETIKDRGQRPQDTIRHYFALDHPLGEICRSFPSDPAMNSAADYCRGLRIIRQPKWECLATFICSSMKQVAHIRQMSHALRKRFGERREFEGQLLHTFPGAAILAATTEAELQKCALGYRAKNLLATARKVASGQADLEKWSQLGDTELRDCLCELPGVGSKVANCVMLFAYERLTAFPIDVWIERVLRERYFAGKRKPSPAKLKQFSEDYFGAHGGYAQQYLFHHARMTAKRSTGKPRKASRKAKRRNRALT